jgi:type VI secretion system protein ImpF
VARREVEVPILQSVWDRLQDEGPGPSSDRAPTRGQSLRQLRDSVRRNLEWILNTRRAIEDLPEKSYLERSVYNYGLPDLSSFALRSAADQNRLTKLLEAAVAAFEPRLMNIRVIMEPPASDAQALHFQIQGLLRVDPAPERIVFDTVLEVTSGTYAVEGQ